MTSIAFVKNTMASDSIITDGCDIVGSVAKIKKVKGYLIGACGDGDVAAWFLDNFTPDIITKKHRIAPPVSMTKEDEFEGIIVTPKGKIYLYTSKFMLLPISAKYIATGSGQPIALGAMAVGASAIEAIKVCIKHDKNSGGRVQSIKL